MNSHFLIAAPWPPAHSEIANNVADTQVPALAKRAQITLLGAQKEEPDSARLRGRTVLGVEEALRQYPNATLIAHLGNQPVYSAAANQALRRHPGFAVLHDVVMHHSLYDQCRAEQRQDDYIAALKRHYGTAGEMLATAACRDASVVHRNANQYPLFEHFLDNAIGVVVHSRMAYEIVADRGAWPVCQLGLPFNAPDAAARTRILAHRGAQAQSLAAGGPLKLIVFGHLGPNRGLMFIIQALTAMRSSRISLDIYGTVADRDVFEDLIARNGLQRAVRIHGHVSDATLDAALLDAHLAINLRSPTLGEASASQLRLYANGLPSIITRHGWYAEQPESAAHFVRARHEVEGLIHILSQVLKEPRQLPGMAAASLDHLRNDHDPDNYAGALCEFIGRNRTPGMRLLLARKYTASAADKAAALGVPHSHALPLGINDLLPN